MVEHEFSAKSSKDKKKSGLGSIMQKFWKQTAVLAGTTVICAGFLATAWHSHQTYKAHVIEEHLTLMQQIADSTAKGLKNFISEHEQQLELIANNPEFIKVLLNKKSDHVEDEHCLMGALYQAHEDDVDGICAINAQGMVTDSHPHDIGLIGTDISYRIGFSQVQKTHKVHVSELFQRKNGIDNSITITVPVFSNKSGEEEFKGALQWLINSDTLYENFLESDLINPDDVWILDNKGTIVSHADGARVGENCMDMHLKTFKKVNWSELETMLAKMQNKQSGQGMYSCSKFSTPDKILKTKLVSYSPIKLDENFLIVGVTKDYKEVSAPIEKKVNHTMLATSAFLLLFGGLGIGFYRSQKKRALLESETKHLKDMAKANEAVILAESRLRAIYENAPNGMVLANLDGQFIKINPAMCKIVGYTEKELLNKTFQDISYPGDICLGVRTAKHVMAGDAISQQFEKRCYHKDGKTVWTNLTISSVRLSADEPVYLVAQIQDITAKKQAEKDKSNLEKKLQQAQKMKALGTLAGGVAHELKDALCAMDGYRSLILELADGESPVKQAVALMQDSGEKVSEMVNDLLTLSRRDLVEKEKIQLNDLVLKYLISDSFEDLHERKSEIAIQTDFEKRLDQIEGSPEQLTKILINLISNATNAIRADGTITIKTRNQYVGTQLNEYTVIKQGQYIVLSIEDTGIGIPQKELNRIFEPFYAKKKLGGHGSGLGLAVVLGVVEDHNGYMDVKSEVGEGTRFEMYFPSLIKKESEE